MSNSKIQIAPTANIRVPASEMANTQSCRAMASPLAEKLILGRPGGLDLDQGPVGHLLGLNDLRRASVKEPKAVMVCAGG